MSDDRPEMDWDAFVAETKKTNKQAATKEKLDQKTAASMAGYIERVVNKGIQQPKAKRPKAKRPIGAHPLEPKIQSSINRELTKMKRAGYITSWERTNSGSVPTKTGYRVRLAKAGTSDNHLMKDGIRWAIEVKRPEPTPAQIAIHKANGMSKPKKTVVTDSQRKYLTDHANSGGISAVVRSVAELRYVLKVGKVGEVVQW